MPNPRLTGSTAAHRQSKTWRYDPQSGVTYCENWASFSERSAWAKRNAFCAAGVSNDFVIERGKYVISTQDTRGQYYLDTWEVAANELSIPSYKNPRHKLRIGTEDPISDDDLNRIASMMNGTSQVSYDELLAQFVARGATRAARLLVRVNRGETHYAFDGTVVRHTTNCPADANGWNRADSWVGTIYSFAELIAECADTTLWIKPMPARLLTKINAIASDLPAAPKYYQWGWLKRRSTESTAADNRVNITNEYWLDRWSEDVYAQCTLLN